MTHIAFVKDFVWLESRDRELVRALRGGQLPRGSLVDRAESWEGGATNWVFVDSSVGNISQVGEGGFVSLVGDYASLPGLLSHPLAGSGRDVVSVWREVYGELLTPGPLLSFLQRLVNHEGGREALVRCDRFWDVLSGAGDVSEAEYLWHASRLAWAAEAVQGAMEPEGGAMVEFVMDYLLWQRAIALDIERIETMAEAGDEYISLGDMLSIWEELDAALCESEEAMRKLLHGWSWPKDVMQPLAARWRHWVGGRADYSQRSLILGDRRIDPA